MKNRVISALVALSLFPVSSAPSFAGSSTLAVTPGSGATLRVGTDGSGNLFGNGGICDGAACAVLATVKAASTAPVATDPALVVGLSPNGNQATAANQTNPQRWIAGNGYGTTWTAVFGTEINSLVNTDAILSSVAVSNGTALDTYISISAALGSITTTSGAPYIGLYLCPLNQDGTTYCGGQFATAAVGPPLSQYYLCSIPLVPSVTQAQEGSCGSLQPIPPGTFKLQAYNLSGATLAASGNTIAAQTYNLAFH